MNVTPWRGIGLTVTQRLLLGLLPSLLAVALVLALAYWGEYGRAAPGHVVIGAAVLAFLSLLATWANARHLARRIGRLAGTGGDGLSARAVSGLARDTDELDRIEEVVDQLGDALTASESARARADRAAADRLREHATMLSATVRSALAQLDEVRLPLHILLEARFGELNENQEELLGDARDAAGAMDAALRRLGQVADADRGALPVQREPVQVNDVVRGVVPLLRAAAERRGGRADVVLEPGLPRVLADRVRLAEALALVGEAAAETVGPARSLVVSTARDRRGVVLAIRVSPAPGPDVTERPIAPDEATPSSGVVLATRLVEAQGGTVERIADGVSLRLG